MLRTRGGATDCTSEVQQQDSVLSLGFVIPPCPSSCLLDFADHTDNTAFLSVYAYHCLHWVCEFEK